jgi:hypothetical protein
MTVSDEMLSSVITAAQAGETIPEPTESQTKPEEQAKETETTEKQEGQENVVQEEGKKEEGQGEVTVEKAEETLKETESQGTSVEQEIKKSTRAEFIEKARSEKEGRYKETALRDELNMERESIARQKAVFEDWQKDPIAYLERTDPTAYQRWTERNIGTMNQQEGQEKTKQNAENAALRAELTEIKKMLQQNQETTQQQAGAVQYQNYMNQVDRILSNPQYDSVREYAEEYEHLTGEKANFHAGASEIYLEFQQKYEKTLSPAEVCEIMLEDSESKLAKFRQKYKLASKEEKTELAQKKKEEKGKKTGGNGSGKTLTNEMESASASAAVDEDWWEKGFTREDIIRQAASTLKYEGNE